MPTTITVPRNPYGSMIVAAAGPERAAAGRARTRSVHGASPQAGPSGAEKPRDTGPAELDAKARPANCSRVAKGRLTAELGYDRRRCRPRRSLTEGDRNGAAEPQALA